MCYKSTRLLVLLVVSAVSVIGCGSHNGSNANPTPLAKQINTNPNLYPAMRQAELQGMKAHQIGGRLRARLQQSAHTAPGG